MAAEEVTAGLQLGSSILNWMSQINALQTQAATLAISAKEQGVQNELQEMTFTANQATAGRQIAELSKNIGFVRDQRELQKRGLKEQREQAFLRDASRQLSQAVQKGDFVRAQKQAGAINRLELATARKVGAAAGRSSFAKARTTLAITSSSQFEDKLTALEEEGLINKAQFTSQLRQFGLAEEEIGLTARRQISALSFQRGEVKQARGLAAQQQPLHERIGELRIKALKRQQRGAEEQRDLISGQSAFESGAGQAATAWSTGGASLL